MDQVADDSVVAVGGVVLHFRAAEGVGGRVLFASERVVAGVDRGAVSTYNVAKG